LAKCLLLAPVLSREDIHITLSPGENREYILKRQVALSLLIDILRCAGIIHSWILSWQSAKRSPWEHRQPQRYLDS